MADDPFERSKEGFDRARRQFERETARFRAEMEAEMKLAAAEMEGARTEMEAEMKLAAAEMERVRQEFMAEFEKAREQMAKDLGRFNFRDDRPPSAKRRPRRGPKPSGEREPVEPRPKPMPLRGGAEAPIE